VWKCLLVILSVVGLGLMPVGVLAATEANVTVTATPNYGILTFAIDYISETQMDLSWTTPPDVTKVMVRAKYGSDLDEIPDEDTAPSDGYLVYYDTGASVSDTSMDFDQNTGPLYYKLWGQKADGTWYVGSESVWQESAIVTLGAFMILALGLFIATFALKSGRRILAFASAGAWMLLGVYSYTRFIDLWDIYYSLFWLSMGMVLVCVLIPVILREKTEDDLSPEVDEYGDYEDDNDPFLGKRKKRKTR